MNEVKFHLLLGRPENIINYATNIYLCPSSETYFLDYNSYVDKIKQLYPISRYISTQNKEMIDVLLLSDLNLDVITVRADEIIKRTKEEALQDRKNFSMELRV